MWGSELPAPAGAVVAAGSIAYSVDAAGRFLLVEVAVALRVALGDGIVRAHREHGVSAVPDPPSLPAVSAAPQTTRAAETTPPTPEATEPPVETTASIPPQPIAAAPSLVQTNPANPSTTNQKEYEPPVIECYPDMQELLLLDPIHEVDETGWPRSIP